MSGSISRSIQLALRMVKALQLGANPHLVLVLWVTRRSPPSESGQGGMSQDQYWGRGRSQMDGHENAIGTKEACVCLEILDAFLKEAHGALFRVWKIGLLASVSRRMQVLLKMLTVTL